MHEFDKFSVTHSGKDAFEREYAFQEVVFERLNGTYLVWNSDPFEYYNLPNGASPDFTGYCELPDLAKQLGFARAYSQDF